MSVLALRRALYLFLQLLPMEILYICSITENVSFKLCQGTGVFSFKFPKQWLIEPQCQSLQENPQMLLIHLTSLSVIVCEL